MDFFDEDILKFFNCLNSADVKYILVGGVAVNYHGFSRSTADLDVWIEDSSKNRENFISAIKNYGIEGAEVFHTLPFIAGYTEILLDNGMHIDLMSELQFFKKENFEGSYEIAMNFKINEKVSVKILHINNLIEEKEKSKRPKDNIDADTLKKLYHK